jgi:hypothetical protein
MLSTRVRRAGAAYFVLFFLAVAAAPHRHLNGLEDLLFDERSDSGLIVQVFGPPGGRESPALDQFRLVHDFPCLACFGGDFVCAATASFLLTTVLAPLPLLPVPPVATVPEIIPTDPSSRAPPLFS